ncbi:MAG TPA: DEAD/DEAH box helicase [Myxococcaceae bacterium]|nr:DEAD/DEAH box helicase [Myxococcaceae bacterium]
MVPELSVLEKALARGDFAAQIQPLDSVVKALRQARARSLQDLDMDTRGRLITTLSRVARQARPAPDPEAPAAPEASAGPVTVPGEAEQAAATTVPPEPVAEEAAMADAGAESAPAPAAPAEASSGASEGTPSTTPAAVVTPARAYAEVLFRVGLAWAAVGEQERADTAFAAAGRRPGAEELQAPSGPVASEPAGGERGAGGRRGGRERPERGERRERRERPGRPERVPRVERVAGVPRGGVLEVPPELAGDWKGQADFLESRGRTRDAARLHDKHGSFLDAARLFEAGGDLRSALRAAVAGKDMDAGRRLATQLPPGEAQTLLEKGEAWELLMELHVKSGRFDEVAKLYERAQQFDQAGLAWERAGKLSAARKAYERARDMASVDRVRTLEVDRLVERGDRLGAALLMVQARRREQAAKLLEPLPPPKAFRFMHQLGLNAEAKALGERELQRATEESKSMARARWLELLERPADAAEAWEAAGRKDKAFPLLEKAGQFGKGARLAEELGNRNEAIRLFRRAGEDAEADRLEALPPAPPPEPMPEPPDHEGVGGVGGEPSEQVQPASDSAAEGSGASEHV